MAAAAMSTYQVFYEDSGRIEKVKVSEDCEVSGLDLGSTFMRIQIFCSEEVKDQFDLWYGEDREVCSRMCAYLFHAHYFPQAQWEMDEDQLHWDLAVLTLLDQLEPIGIPDTVEPAMEEG